MTEPANNKSQENAEHTQKNQDAAKQPLSSPENGSVVTAEKTTGQRQHSNSDEEVEVAARQSASINKRQKISETAAATIPADEAEE